MSIIFAQRCTIEKKRENNANGILVNLFLIVFICFLGMGISISVLPIYVKSTLHLNNFWVAIIIALQYASMFLTRGVAGNAADGIGTKFTLLWGIVLGIVSGLVYLAGHYSSFLILKVILIASGRVLTGLSESLMVTGALAFAMNQAGSQHAGKIMAWNGNAVYGGAAFGAICGGWLINSGGFLWICYALIILPSLALLLAYHLRPQSIIAQARLPFYKVVDFILLPGLGLFLATVGYGVILSFISLLFYQYNWTHYEWGFACFGVSYVIARVFFSSLPDKLGGVKVAFFSLLIELLGQILIFGGHEKYLVILGIGLSGFGFSLVVPSLGIEAIKRVPPQNRGSAMGAFLAFFDLSFCIAVPIAGVIAKNGYQLVYLLGIICTGLGLWIVNALKRNPLKVSFSSDFPLERRK